MYMAMGILFESISYQLEHCPKNSRFFRKKLVSYLRENAEKYKYFVCAVVPSTDAYNSDTECPDEYDSYIASITNTEQSQKLLWEKYLNNLCNGAWRDNLAIQCISVMFKIIIKVLQIQPNNRVLLTTVKPSNSTSSNITIINIGSLLQYHFVGLDPIPLSSSTASVCNDTYDVNNTTAPHCVTNKYVTVFDNSLNNN